MRNFLLLFFGALLVLTVSCRRGNTEFVTVALPESFSTLDTLTTTASDSAAERVRNLLFNSLVRKNANFEYVGELASDITTSEDGKTITFVLRDNVKFHNGKNFTSADVKYTFDKLFESNGYKSGAFFDTVNKQRVAHIVSLETPDPITVIFTVASPALKNKLLSNLVTIPIVPEGTVEQQKTQPIGSGPFKFVSFDASQNIVEMQSNTDYWEGAPKVDKLRIKTVTDASSLQAELQTGGVDLAPNPSNMPPDTLKLLGQAPNLKIEQFDGSNVQYLIFNTSTLPLNNTKIRQGIGYAVDRDKIINELFFGQAKVAHSILPPQSWAYSAGTQYAYDPDKAKQLLREAGYKDEPIVFKYSSGNAAVNQYSQVIHEALNSVGLNVRVETLEVNTIRENLKNGQFQMYTGIWIGGNQDPMFLRDLFATKMIPSATVSCCNRGRYSNREVDELLEDAFNEVDKEKAKQLYIQAWQKISDDLPLFPLWYPANIIIANKRIGNIQISPSGDWSFIKDITVNN